jgi:hypothetical protein
MENNKFNKFYSKISATELIEQLRAHRINIQKLDEEWYEALKVHLSERELSTEERKVIDHILSDDFFKEIENFNKNKIENGHKRQIQSNLNINPTKIVSAGRNIKNVVYAVLVMTLIVVFATFTAINSKNPETIKNAYLFLGIASLICNIVILFQLHSAGDNLEYSINKKEE